MRFRRHSTDANHANIRDGLAQLGYDVHDTAAAGGGLVDLIVGLRSSRSLALLEVKRAPKDWRGGNRGVSPSDIALTPAQVAFHRKWALYPVFVVHSLDEAHAKLKALEACA